MMTGCNLNYCDSAVLIKLPSGNLVVFLMDGSLDVMKDLILVLLMTLLDRLAECIRCLLVLSRPYLRVGVS